MKENHLVSIVLPVYNGQRFLSETIESCLNQSYSNFELIIVDDASTDGSLNIAKKFQNNDARIKIIENKTNSKLPQSLNNGIIAARGDYMTWTSDDNILEPYFIKNLLGKLLSTNSDFVYSDYLITDKNLETLKLQTIGNVSELIFQNVIGASFMGKAKVFKDSFYDVNLYKVEDYAFWLMNLPIYKCIKFQEPVYKYRLHGDSLTSQIKNDGGFKFDLIKRMFSICNEKLSLSVSAIDFLVWNQIDKKEASRILYVERKNIIQEILYAHKTYLQLKEGLIFRSHIKHFQKLLDLLAFQKAIAVSFQIVTIYPFDLFSMKWLIIYFLKRIKRIMT